MTAETEDAADNVVMAVLAAGDTRADVLQGVFVGNSGIGNTSCIVGSSPVRSMVGAERSGMLPFRAIATLSGTVAIGDVV